MRYLNKIVAFASLALGFLALAGILTTDAYSHAAQAEARGDDMLTHYIASGTNSLCLNDAASDLTHPIQSKAVEQ